MKKTVKDAYKEVGMKESGEFVNDFMVECGIDYIQIGRKKLKVEKPKTDVHAKRVELRDKNRRSER